MNRKLFRKVTLVVTVLLALAITAPVLATEPGAEIFIWDEDFPAINCDNKKGDEIWVQLHYNWQVRYEYDEYGELVGIIYHNVDHWHVYNKLYPELFIEGLAEGTGHFNEVKGEWGTGISMNFHAPGYPQLAHLSGYWTFDEGYNPIIEHGRLEEVDVALFCELLTPP